MNTPKGKGKKKKKKKKIFAAHEWFVLKQPQVKLDLLQEYIF